MDRAEEYEYFQVFVRQTIPKTCPLLPINFLHLHSMTMDLIHIVLSKSHDIDGIRWKCGDILAMLFSISNDMPTIQPCQESSHYIKVQGRRQDNYALIQELIPTVRELIMYFIKSTMCYWDSNFFEKFQSLIYDYAHKLWELSDLDNIHDLMSLRIQMYCHYHLRNEKIAQGMSKPFMKFRYESKSIHPLKYYWNPESKDLLEFVNSVNNIQLGIEYDIEVILRALISAAKYRIHDLKIDPNIVENELSQLLNCNIDDIDLDDRRTLLWPLLYHVYTKTFEEIWSSKHWFPRTPMTLRRMAVQSANAAATSASESIMRAENAVTAAESVTANAAAAISAAKQAQINTSNTINHISASNLRLNIPAIDLEMEKNWRPDQPTTPTRVTLETYYNHLDHSCEVD
jgi:hypothetical protein